MNTEPITQAELYRRQAVIALVHYFALDEEEAERRILAIEVAAAQNAVATNGMLIAAINKYGGHLLSCSCLPTEDGYLNRKCNCGLRTMLASVEKIRQRVVGYTSVTGEDYVMSDPIEGLSTDGR